jgi:hypothetical protein
MCEETESSASHGTFGLGKSVAAVENYTYVFPLRMFLRVAVVCYISGNCGVDGMITTLSPGKYGWKSWVKD